MNIDVGDVGVMVGEHFREVRQHAGPIGDVAQDRVGAHERLNHIIPNTMNRQLLFVALLVAAFLPRAAAAQGQPTMYGPSIVAEQAKTIAAAAIAEAKKNQWTMAIAIVDTAGDLVYFERMDHTQVGSVDIAQAKARSSARFKRPTKAFQDALAAGGEGWRILSLEGAVAVEGGIPLMSGGKIIGAIGASGGTSQQDGVTAAAGAATLK
jgi:glc operon protein GlcG